MIDRRESDVRPIQYKGVPDKPRGLCIDEALSKTRKSSHTDLFIIKLAGKWVRKMPWFDSICKFICRIWAIQLHRYPSQWNHFNFWYKWHRGYSVLHPPCGWMWFGPNDKQERHFGWCTICWNGECCQSNINAISFWVEAKCISVFMADFVFAPFWIFGWHTWAKKCDSTHTAGGIHHICYIIICSELLYLHCAPISQWIFVSWLHFELDVLWNVDSICDIKFRQHVRLLRNNIRLPQWISWESASCACNYGSLCHLFRMHGIDATLGMDRDQSKLEVLHSVHRHCLQTVWKFNILYFYSHLNENLIFFPPFTGGGCMLSWVAYLNLLRSW